MNEGYDLMVEKYNYDLLMEKYKGFRAEVKAREAVLKNQNELLEARNRNLERELYLYQQQVESMAAILKSGYEKYQELDSLNS